MSACAKVLLFFFGQHFYLLATTDPKQDKEKAAVICHPHPLVPNKTKKGKCNECKKPVAARGKKDADGSSRCESCEYFLCPQCRNNARPPRVSEYTTEVLIKVGIFSFPFSVYFLIVDYFL